MRARRPRCRRPCRRCSARSRRGCAAARRGSRPHRSAPPHPRASRSARSDAPSRALRPARGGARRRAARTRTSTRRCPSARGCTRLAVAGQKSRLADRGRHLEAAKRTADVEAGTDGATVRIQHHNKAAQFLALREELEVARRVGRDAAAGRDPGAAGLAAGLGRALADEFEAHRRVAILRRSGAARGRGTGIAALGGRRTGAGTAAGCLIALLRDRSGSWSGRFRLGFRTGRRAALRRARDVARSPRRGKGARARR